MISFVATTIASVAGFIPTDIWYAIIVGGSILFGLTGNGWLTLVKALLGCYAFWLFLSVIAFILPDWLETVVVLVMVLLVVWAYRS